MFLEEGELTKNTAYEHYINIINGLEQSTI